LISFVLSYTPGICRVCRGEHSVAIEGTQASIDVSTLGESTQAEEGQQIEPVPVELHSDNDPELESVKSLPLPVQVLFQEGSLYEVN